MTVLQFSDGTTTIDLLDSASTGYGLYHGGWAPQIARRKRGVMGGSPYEDVRETMDIVIVGSSTTNCLSKLQDLMALFEQANVWGEGGNVTAVELQYQHKNSSAQVESIIYDTEVINPGTFASMGNQNFRLEPVRLNFTRRALWLGGTENQSSAVSTGNPTIRTISSNFSDDANILMPYDAYIDFETGAAAKEPTDAEMYFCFTNSSDKLQIEEGEGRDSDTGSPATTAATYGSAGNVLRWGSGNSGGTASWTNTVFNSFNSNSRTFLLLAVVRNSTASTTANIYWEFFENTALFYTTVTKTIDGDEQTAPYILPYIITLPQAASNYSVRCNVSKDTTAVVDLDYWCLVGMDDSTRVIYLPRYLTVSSQGDRIHINHRLDSNLNGTLYGDEAGSGVRKHQAYEGDVILASTGNTISCLIMGVIVPESGNNDRYIIYNTAELDAHIDVTRTKAYLTPV